MDNELVEATSGAESSDGSVDLRCKEILPSRSGSDERSSSSESDSDESVFPIGCFRHFPVTLKEKSEWNFARYITRREIGFQSFREKM